MRKHLIVAASLMAVALVGPATAGAERDSLAAARAATAKFHGLQTAIAHGYGKLVDAQGIACIDNPGVGGMGIHYVNDEARRRRRSEGHARPRCSCTSRGRTGGSVSSPLEYVVFQSAWDQAHERPPKLFGRRVRTDSSWRIATGFRRSTSCTPGSGSTTRAGMFDDWNPRVSCAAAPARSIEGRVAKTHKYKSTISSATLSTANGYPSPGGTAVMVGAMRLTGFGEGALVDRVKITGQPKPNVFSFSGPRSTTSPQGHGGAPTPAPPRSSRMDRKKLR